MAERCQWNSLELRDLPVLVFEAQRKWRLAEPEAALGTEHCNSHCNSHDQNMAAGCILNRTLASKVETPVDVQSSLRLGEEGQRLHDHLLFSRPTIRFTPIDALSKGVRGKET